MPRSISGEVGQGGGGVMSGRDETSRNGASGDLGHFF